MRFDRDFQRTIRVAAVAPPPNLYPDSFVRDDSTMEMLEYNLLMVLMEVLNFKSKIFEPDDKEYGRLLPDGNWTGIVGLVQKEKADFGFGLLGITEERLLAVDFSYPFLYAPVTFITDKPTYVSNGYAVFQPFSFLVWGIIFISVVIMAFVSYVSQTQNDSPQKLIFVTYGILTGQSMKLRLKKRCIHLLMSLWIICAMILSQSYKCVLLSFLTFPSLTGVRDISQLSTASEDPYFKCSAFKGNAVYHVLETADDESWNKIAKCMNRSNMFTNDIDAFLRPNNYKKAFIELKSTLMPLSDNYFISDQNFYGSMVAVAVRKTFCCKKTLDEFILKIAAVGILDKFIQHEKFLIKLAEKNLESDDEPAAIRKLCLVDVMGAFIVLIFGHALGFIAFVLEIILSRESLAKK